MNTKRTMFLVSPGSVRRAIADYYLYVCVCSFVCIAYFINDCHDDDG